MSRDHRDSRSSLTVEEARAELLSGKGYTRHAVLEMAVDVAARSVCELQLLRVMETTPYAQWRCACGHELAVTGGLDDAYLDYDLHRHGADTWRTYLEALSRWAVIDADEGEQAGVVRSLHDDVAQARYQSGHTEGARIVVGLVDYETPIGARANYLTVGQAHDRPWRRRS